LACGSADGSISTWRIPDGVPLLTLPGHPGEVERLSISANGRMLVSAGSEGSIRIWRLSDGFAIETLPAQADWVRCLAISSDGSLLASSGEGASGAVWAVRRLPGGAVLKRVDAGSDLTTAVAIGPRGRLLASGDAHGTVWLSRFPDGTPLKRLVGHSGEIASLALSPDGQFLVSGSLDGTVRLWGLGLLLMDCLPIGQMSPGIPGWVQDALRSETLSDSERCWLEFLMAMMRYRWRYDVEIDLPTEIVHSEFDIEIEGTR
jgi:WD40 repeat protein